MHAYPGRSRKGNTDLAHAIRGGATLVGEDGKGKNGLVSYFKRLAWRHPQAMANLLGKVLSWQTQQTCHDSAPPLRRWTDEEISKLPTIVMQFRAMLETKAAGSSQANERNAHLPRAVVEGATLVGEDGKGKNGLAGYLKRLARHHPQAMGNLLGKLLPWPDEDNEAEPKRPIEEVIEEMVAKLVGTRSEETLAQEDPDSDQR